MTEKCTPEKVAELVAEARAWTREDAEGAPRNLRRLARHMADALTAVSAERDEAWRIGAAQHGYNPTDDEQAGNFMRLAKRADRAEAERDDWEKAYGEAVDREAHLAAIILPRIRADRDRLHKAITEALDWRDEAYHGALGKDEFAQGYGYARRAIGRILRAALDKEGNDDE